MGDWGIPVRASRPSLEDLRLRSLLLNWRLLHRRARRSVPWRAAFVQRFELLDLVRRQHALQLDERVLTHLFALLLHLLARGTCAARARLLACSEHRLALGLENLLHLTLLEIVEIEQRGQAVHV